MGDSKETEDAMVEFVHLARFLATVEEHIPESVRKTISAAGEQLYAHAVTMADLQKKKD